MCYCASCYYQLGVRGVVTIDSILGGNKGVDVARVVESYTGIAVIDKGDGASTDVVMTDVGAMFNSDLTLGDWVSSLVRGSDGDVVMTDVGAMVNIDLTLGDQVSDDEAEIITHL